MHMATGSSACGYSACGYGLTWASEMAAMRRGCVTTIEASPPRPAATISSRMYCGTCNHRWGSCNPVLPACNPTHPACNPMCLRRLRRLAASGLAAHHEGTVVAQLSQQLGAAGLCGQRAADRTHLIVRRTGIELLLLGLQLRALPLRLRRRGTALALAATPALAPTLALAATSAAVSHRITSRSAARARPLSILLILYVLHVRPRLRHSARC